MKAFLLLVFLACGLSPARAADTPSAAVPAQPTVQERLANARKAVSAGNWNAAMRELNVAVREEPRAGGDPGRPGFPPPRE